jgi:hypothetical protein
VPGIGCEAGVTTTEKVRRAARRAYAASPTLVKKTYRRGKFAYWRATDPLYMVPDYLIIGAHRAGTSSLYTYLRRNNHVGPASRKEVHFFDFHYHRGLDWYRRQFPSVITKRLAERRHGLPFLTGEATPYYLVHPRAPQRVHETLPSVKLIALLRDPVARAYSHYQQQCRFGNETLPFEQALEREFDSADEGMDPGLDFRRFSYLERGIYADQLERWLSLFPRDRLLVLSSEDLFHDPSSVERTACAFLRIPPRPVAGYRPYNGVPYAKLATSTRALLSDYYRPHNRRLYELVGRDFGWD